MKVTEETCRTGTLEICEPWPGCQTSGGWFCFACHKLTTAKTSFSIQETSDQTHSPIIYVLQCVLISLVKILLRFEKLMFCVLSLERRKESCLGWLVTQALLLRPLSRLDSQGLTVKQASFFGQPSLLLRPLAKPQRQRGKSLLASSTDPPLGFNVFEDCLIVCIWENGVWKRNSPLKKSEALQGQEALNF